MDLLAAVALAAILMAGVLPAIRARLDASVAASATRYVATRFQQARINAVLRSASVGVRFGPSTDEHVITTYVDGDNDGIRTEDIRDGTDGADGPAARLSELFPGVRIGVLDGLPAIEGSADPPGNDPVRFGAARLMSFAADGSATPGTLYLLGVDGSQYAVRVAGETGRVRPWTFDRRGRIWRPM